MNSKSIFLILILISVITLGLVTQSVARHHDHHHRHRHNHLDHHHHHHHQDPRPTPTPPPPPPPRPTPPPPVNSGGDRAQLIKSLKKSQHCGATSSCPKGKLILSGLRGNGILVDDAVIVSKDGTGDFTTIGEAIGVAPQHYSRAEDGFFVIYVKAGIYEEYISIPRTNKNILLLGDGINATVITGNRTAAGGRNAYGSPTFAVAGDRFTAIDVTFRNTAGPGIQAVALRNRADLSAFFRCSFEGYQDTLYAHSNTQFYRDCDVYGTIDFIFGDPAGVFQNSRIIARRANSITVTAEGRTGPDQKTGIVFHNCSIIPDSDFDTDDGDNSAGGHHHRRRHGSSRAYLGRPWERYARVVYMQSYIGGFINPAGWREMDSSNALDTVYYGEYQNYGPGSDTSDRVDRPGVKKAMSLSEALSFTVHNFTNGASWLPYTDIPFIEGLL